MAFCHARQSFGRPREIPETGVCNKRCFGGGVYYPQLIAGRESRRTNAVSQAGEIAAILEAQGMPMSTPVVLVENASLPDSRHVGTTLRGLRNGAARGMAGPALLLFGDVFRKRAHALIARDLMADEAPLQAFPAQNRP